MSHGAETTLAEKDLLTQNDGRSANGAPEGEPEAWDETIPTFNPLLARPPEPTPVTVSAAFATQNFQVEEYLAEERSKDLLRFSTAGSVDDGKSTLIGRLLYDTQSVYDDQVRSIEGKGTTAPGVLDLALLTDGLRAEREQGITIDVAYRYFSTSRRKFIIADTPGHEQYTRNMATGASTADAAVILIDARKGLLSQSRRHSYITALLGVRHIIVAINKMDLVGYAQDTFEGISGDFTSFLSRLNVRGLEKIQVHFVPVSALAGDNVVHPSSAMPWYRGEPLLGLLEGLPAAESTHLAPFRFAVQRVVRPHLDFRGFAGQIASGTVHVGDDIVVLPSGRRSQVKEIVTFDGNLEQAAAPLSVTLTLQDEVDISRGDVLAAADAPPSISNHLEAAMVWMDVTPLDLGRRYLLKHMSRTVQAFVRRVNSLVDLSGDKPAGTVAPAALKLNEIARISVEVLQPLAADAYNENRQTGSFILIDPLTSLTVAAGMIEAVADTSVGTDKLQLSVSQQERQLRYRHTGAHLQVLGSIDLLNALERALFARGALVLNFGKADGERTDIAAAGAIALSLTESSTPLVRVTRSKATHDINLVGYDIVDATREVLKDLHRCGVLLGEDSQ